MDIEIVETNKRSIKQRKTYIKKQVEITSLKEKINNVFIRADKEDCLKNRALLVKLIDTCINKAFEEGQSFGREKIVYKETGDNGEGWDKDKVYIKGHYAGD